MENNYIVDISQNSAQDQKDFLYLCYTKCQRFIKDETKWDKTAFISDTHGDFLALLISLLEAGVVEIKANCYNYYGLQHHKFVGNINISDYINYNDKNKDELKNIFENINKCFNKNLNDVFSIYKDFYPGYSLPESNSKDFNKVFEGFSDDEELIQEIKKFYRNNFVTKLCSFISPEDVMKLRAFSQCCKVGANKENNILKLKKFFNENKIEICDENIEIMYDTIKKYHFILVPTPFINEKYTGQFYHLGDVVDRGQESILSLLFLERICDLYKKANPDKEIPIHIVVGNHEADNCNTHPANGAQAHELYKPILARMLRKRYLSSGYLIKNKDNPILATHSVFLELDVVILFISFYRICRNSDNSYDLLKKSVFKEFFDSNEEELQQKICDFVFNSYKALFCLSSNKSNIVINKIFEKIKSNFSAEELIKIRTIMLDATLKMNIDDQGRIIEGGDIQSYVKTNGNDNDLVMCNPDTGLSIGFWPRIYSNNTSNPFDNVVCDQCIGHDSNLCAVAVYNLKGMFKQKNTVVDFDTCRSYKSGIYNTIINYGDLDNIKSQLMDQNTRAVTTYYDMKNDYIDLSKIFTQSSYCAVREVGEEGQLCDCKLFFVYSYACFCNSRESFAESCDAYLRQKIMMRENKNKNKNFDAATQREKVESQQER